MVVKSGISQTGGKFRLRKRLCDLTPYHEFMLSLFLGAAHFELNKPRCRYECWNDAESDIINYLVQIQLHPKEFDAMKQGVYGLVSQEICNRIVNGKIEPKNDLEKAYFFYYLNKLTFGGSIWKVRKKPPYNGIDPAGRTQEAVDKIKEEFERKTKGYIGLIDNQTMSMEGYGRVDSKVVEHAKANFRGVVPKAGYRGVPPAGFQQKVEQAKEKFKQRNSAYKGMSPKTTRPYTNNDCGLLSPIEPSAIKRMRYVNLTAYDFRRVYKMFYEAFHVRKGLNRECFIYADPPYPGTEKYYGDLFSKDDHQDLIDILVETPFNFMLSIGGNCEETYIKALKENNWVIKPVKVKYSTDANSQKDSKEYICMNYEIQDVAKMILDSNQKTIESYY